MDNPEFEKDQLACIIESRIRAEHRKHPDLNWQLIAAKKILLMLVDRKIISSNIVRSCTECGVNQLIDEDGYCNCCGVKQKWFD